MLTTLPYEFGKTSVVLGAGATVGTTLREADDRPRPPLDTDFFTQIQRLKNIKHVEYVNALLRFCHEEFGPGWSLGMEQFYNHVWYAQKFRPSHALEFPIEGRKAPLSLEALFKQVLLAVFEESLYGLHSQDPLKNTCELHDELAVNLQNGDSVLSFNYDCVMDCSLVKKCPYWRVGKSYAVAPVINKNSDYWAGIDLEDEGVVYHHKLHGSVNWQLQDGETLKLKARPYTKQNGISNYFIVPPVISKGYMLDDSVLAKVWSSAYSELSSADTALVVGYSVPPADALANAMLASRAHSEEPKGRQYLRALVIANPDREARHRIIRIFRQSIGKDTKVLVFDSFSMMNECLFKGETELS